MKFTSQYITSMISCAESKLAAASSVSRNREYFGMYGLTDSIWHINQLILYIFLLKRWNNTQGAINALTEEGVSHIFDRIIRMPYPCDLQAELVMTIPVNRPPIVNAGVDQNLSVGTTSSVLAGTASDPDGDPMTTQWTKVSGGNVTINSTGSLITSITNMQPGTYVFRLMATDSNNLSASDDIIVTIAQALDTIYYGRDNNPFPGVGQVAYIQAGNSLQADSSQDIQIPWFNGATGPQYCWVAIPDRTPASIKNKWFVDIINQGNMGSSTDLFGSYQTFNISGIDYLVWETNYQTQFSLTCTLKKV